MDVSTSKVELVKFRAGYRSSITNSKSKANERLKELVEEIVKIEICNAVPEDFVIYINVINGCLFKFSMLSQNVKDFYKNYVVLDIKKAVNIALNTVNKNNVCWIRERRLRITASKAYHLYTYASNPNPDWNKKIKNYVRNNFKGNSNTRYDIIMEQAAINAYERQTDFQVTRIGLLVNPLLPWLGSSLDGVMKNSHTVEIKCPKEGKEKSASNIVNSSALKFLTKDMEENVTVKENHMYFCQVQLGMFLSGLDTCHFNIYSAFSDSCFVIDISYDKKPVFDRYLPTLQYVYFCNMLTFLADPTNKTCDAENCDPNMS